MLKLSEETRRKYSILVAITTSNSPSLLDISNVTGIPSSSVKRYIAQIRSEFLIDLRFIQANNGRGRRGHYHIFHWGVIDRSEFLINFGSILDAQEKQVS
ncbi:helix-turn-helix domain-containing protein [Spartinivicinus poritis]|uniref:helix-turn-helix domain-containing protein n=1 Tax=Spartinivicinus poritis TaxID=2994640 RepID=UPI003CC915E6